VTVTLLLVTTDLTGQPLGLRERQKHARRATLIDAAHDLVERHGLDAVTVDAICAEAGVSSRTFFNYFESKDDAVLGMEPLSIDSELAEAFAGGGPTGDIATDLEALARAVLVAPVMTRQRMVAAAELARREPRLSARYLAWMERYREQVEALLRRRLAAPSAEGRADAVDGGREALVELIGMMLMVMIRSAVTRWEAAGAHGEVADHLSAVQGDLRMLLGPS
jgi:AcrR family transcriptional regulator